jgi:hypothetical protein
VTYDCWLVFQRRSFTLADKGIPLNENDPGMTRRKTINVTGIERVEGIPF